MKAGEALPPMSVVQAGCADECSSPCPTPTSHLTAFSASAPIPPCGWTEMVWVSVRVCICVCACMCVTPIPTLPPASPSPGASRVRHTYMHTSPSRHPAESPQRQPVGSSCSKLAGRFAFCLSSSRGGAPTPKQEGRSRSAPVSLLKVLFGSSRPVSRGAEPTSFATLRW